MKETIARIPMKKMTQNAQLSSYFFEDGGSDAILKMTNFDAEEFDYIWGLLSNFVIMNYNVGRDRKSDACANMNFL